MWAGGEGTEGLGLRVCVALFSRRRGCGNHASVITNGLTKPKAFYFSSTRKNVSIVDYYSIFW